MRYKKTHANHPSRIWSGETYGNFKWMLKLGIELSKEYSRRYGKIHKCDSIFKNLVRNMSACRLLFDKEEMTTFALVMDDECKVGNVVQSYREYYTQKKSKIAKWEKLNKIPGWYKA